MGKGVYFKNLNSLRFFAALMVIFHHFQLSQNVDPVSFLGKFSFGIGKLAVVLFFVLSGFLITYLLLDEKSKNGKINIRSFYIRRICRIWPLYFIIVLGSLYVFNNLPIFRIPDVSVIVHDSFWTKNILYILMLPNLAYAFSYSLPFADQVWSIGVEEQFYLFWPLLFINKKKILNKVLWVIIIYLIVKLLITLISIYHATTFFEQLSFLIRITSFDSMAIGAIAAIMLFNKSKFLPVLYHPLIQYLLFSVLFFSLLLSLDFGFFNYEVYSILYAYLILNLASNHNVIFNIENKVFNYLGKISYGLYMYHFLAMRIGVLFEKYFIDLPPWIHFLFVVLVTVVISAISYEIIEKYFINLKNGFRPRFRKVLAKAF